MKTITPNGFPSPAEEELADVISFDEYLMPRKDASYMLKVRGDAMRAVGICEGDMVIVERRSQAAPGQIVVALVENEYVMRFLRKSNGQYYLEAADADANQTTVYEAFQIEAVVTALVRKY